MVYTIDHGKRNDIKEQLMVWTDLSEFAKQSILTRSSNGESSEQLAKEYDLKVVSLDRKLRQLRPKLDTGFTRRVHNLTVSNPLRTMVYGDTHFGVEDPKAIELFLKVAAKFKPQLLIHLGDVNNWDTVSRFVTSPRSVQIQEERYRWYFFAERLNAVCPDAEKFALIGNHDRRIRNWLATQAPELFDLDELSLDNLLYFPELGYHPMVDEIRINPSEDPLFPDALLYLLHGETARKGAGSSVRAESDVFASASVIMGHAHRSAMICRRTHRGYNYSYEVGTLANMQQDYDAFPDWSQSFLTGIIGSDFFDFDMHKIYNGTVRYQSELITV